MTINSHYCEIIALLLLFAQCWEDAELLRAGVTTVKGESQDGIWFNFKMRTNILLPGQGMVWIDTSKLP